MKQSTLVILTPGFPASEDDSTCLPLQQMLTREIHQSFPWIKIHVLSFQYPYRNAVYPCAGATVHSFGNRNRGHVFNFLLRKRILKKLELIRARENLVGLFSFWYGECAAIGKLFSMKYSIPHFCWILGQDAKPGNKHPALIKLSPDEIVAISDFSRSEFYKNYNVLPSRVIIPGVVNLKDKNLQLPRDIDILGVGSLIPLKQFHLFLEMVAIAREDHPGLRCLLAGAGPEKEKLMNHILRLGLQSNVFLLGEVSHSRVLDSMSRTKILLHTSSYEGFSGVCLEAISRGAFVLSFTRPMDAEIPQWFIAEDEMEMVRKLKLLLKRDDHQPVLNFPIENTARKIIELFVDGPCVLQNSLPVSSMESD